MIGQLRTRIALYRAEETPDEFGGSVIQWVFETGLWAAIMPKTATERLQNGRLAVTQSYHVVTHFKANFPERARLLWGERHLRVIAASDPDNRRERLHLVCEEEQQ